MFFIESSSPYFFPDIPKKSLRRFIRRFKQTFGRNSDVFKLFLELSRLQIMSECDFGKKFPRWLVDTLIHQLGYILQRNPKDVLNLNSGSCDLMCNCFSLPAPLHFPGALDAVVIQEVRSLLFRLIDDPDSFGWMLDRNAEQAVQNAFKDHDYDSMFVASSATPSAAASSAAPSASSSSSLDGGDCPMYD